MSIRKGTNVIAGRSVYRPDLFDIKWADHLLNDPQWLRADTFSWQNGTVYSAAYNHLVSDITNINSQTETVYGITITFYQAVDGHKIVLVDQLDNVVDLFNMTGIAWYYVLDTTNEQFKLPRTKFGFQGISNEVGRYTAPGLPNITGTFGINTRYNENDMLSRTSGAFSFVNQSIPADYVSDNDVGGYVMFDAFKSSPIYGSSSTVQSPATQMYLYFYIGAFSQSALENTAGITTETLNTKADLSFVQSTRATIDLDNLSTDGKNISTWSNNVSNCITEIPQDIKLELNSGTLTLKAGSKLYVPNGFEQDGTTPHFDIVTISSDLIAEADTERTAMHFLNPEHDSIDTPLVPEYCFSGTTAPTSFYFNSWAMWYDTTANVIKRTNDAGVTWVSGFSLPLCIAVETTSAYTNIQQIFNGFGYIGSTVFALPGVKGLIPNGRNSDGTLKSIPLSLVNVATYTSPYANVKDYQFNVNSEGNILIPGNHTYSYDETQNLYFMNGVVSQVCNCGNFATDSNNKIISFIKKEVFHSVGYSEADFVVAFQRPTADNGYTWYRKYKSGWVEQGGKTDVMSSNTITTINLPVAMSDTNYTITACERYDGGTSDNNNENYWVSTLSTTTVGVYNSADGYKQLYWEVKGMAA